VFSAAEDVHISEISRDEFDSRPQYSHNLATNIETFLLGLATRDILAVTVVRPVLIGGRMTFQFSFYLYVQGHGLYLSGGERLLWQQCIDWNVPSTLKQNRYFPEPHVTP
jgi:hypothetical protein